jgi:hypothetical protein
MNFPLHHVIRPGLVHFMAFPATIKGDGPVLKTCRQITKENLAPAKKALHRMTAPRGRWAIRKSQTDRYR